MQIVSDFALAYRLASQSVPFFFTTLPVSRSATTAQHVLGRRYRGLFDESDGSFVTLTATKRDQTVIDRDCYGGIPLFYSVTKPIISTNLQLFANMSGSEFDYQAIAEYLSAAYLTGGRTIYRNVRVVMPDEVTIVDGKAARTSRKSVFPKDELKDTKEICALLEQALDRSISDLLERHPNELLLNLSGGTDSTLILAKLREADQRRKIITNTYFHNDWRDDINDWEYAQAAANTFASDHRLIKIDNAAFCQAHKDLVARAKNVFHTYAAAFYLQNDAVSGAADIPIVNGSGPDESIIGTEKIPIRDLLRLRSLPRAEWIDHLISRIDYIKIPESVVAEIVRGDGGSFTASRRELASALSDAPDFLEFQRRYHAFTILQDHIQELASVAQVLGREILFPYLTNDIFKILFSARFESLNVDGIYKSVLKRVLETRMPKEFVHRKKIGFQSPSRPYFMSKLGLGAAMTSLLQRGESEFLNMAAVRPAILQRLQADLDLRGNYDFFEWTVYNILLLESLRSRHV
jgi:asparagine synthetase B (glutamine-hydrolysing)